MMFSEGRGGWWMQGVVTPHWTTPSRHTRSSTSHTYIRTIHAPDGAEGSAPQPLLKGQREDNGPARNQEEEPGGQVGVLGKVP